MAPAGAHFLEGFDPSQARYFDFFVSSATADDLCIEAVPKAMADGLEARSMDEAEVLYTAGGCGGGAAGGTLHTTANGRFGIRVDGSRWRVGGSDDNADAELEFQHAGGEGFALVISEDHSITLAELREIALQNLRSVASDARVLEEERRRVSGREVLAMRMDGTVDGIPIRYYGYYYSGEEGTVQALTFTTQDQFTEHEADFAAFLDGLEIYPPAEEAVRR